MNLLTQYAAAIERCEITNNPLQREVLNAFQVIVDNGGQSSWFSRKQRSRVKGIYLYGSVGVGKTYLMDMFYHELRGKKARFHFHHFMQVIDEGLRRLQGHKNPLRQIAKDLAKKVNVLCLDELLVHDVAHAMMLAQLFQALIHYGLILVFTSNTAPDELYFNGLGRERFLPAIALIKQHCTLVHLKETKDYRFTRLPHLMTYLYPISSENQDIMEQQFKVSFERIQENGVISIHNRDISYFKCAKNAIWFDFNRICNLPRCQLDYLEIAKQFETIFLSNLPNLNEHVSVQTLMFIHFIDIMYDWGVKLIILAEVPVEDLYKEGSMPEAFKRTQSRLFEMQSKEYLFRPHGRWC